jgi:Ca2+/H+ antiporter, TMEM165/GDT1 family
MTNAAAVASAVTAAFLASLVEVVEAFTLVLAAAVIRGWRPALAGAGLGLLCLAALVAILGPVLWRIPLGALHVVVGVLLLLFGMRWLRKAVLRGAGLLPLHDEDVAFARETNSLRDAARLPSRSADFVAGLTAFKGVMLEGVEVAFIVIAVGAERGLLAAASFGALIAAALVAALGAFVHKPLSKIPENALKFIVGAMLSAFGVFWTTEGLGGRWPGGDVFLPALAATFALIGLALAHWLRPTGQKLTKGAR